MGFLLFFGWLFLISSSEGGSEPHQFLGGNQFRPKKLFFFDIIFRSPETYLKL